MNQDFQNIINQYRAGQLEGFRIRNQSFSTGTIANEALTSCVFINVNFLDVNFTNVGFASSFFTDCSLQNCIFDRTSLRDAEFRNCSLKNCCLRNCNLTKADFTETIFDNCSFEKTEEGKGNLAKAWFESCHFLETNFNGFGIVTLIETAVVDSKFSKFNKSIEFKGEFFLSDILHPDNGLEGMFIES